MRGRGRGLKALGGASGRQSVRARAVLLSRSPSSGRPLMRAAALVRQKVAGLLLPLAIKERDRTAKGRGVSSVSAGVANLGAAHRARAFDSKELSPGWQAERPLPLGLGGRLMGLQLRRDLGAVVFSRVFSIPGLLMW